MMVPFASGDLENIVASPSATGILVNLHLWEVKRLQLNCLEIGFRLGTVHSGYDTLCMLASR